MKVVYTSIEQLVVEAICRADRDGMKISRIELTPYEFTYLMGELKDLPMRHMIAEEQLRSGTVIYMGTRIVRVPE